MYAVILFPFCFLIISKSDHALIHADEKDPTITHRHIPVLVESLHALIIRQGRFSRFPLIQQILTNQQPML